MWGGRGATTGHLPAQWWPRAAASFLERAPAVQKESFLEDFRILFWEPFPKTIFLCDDESTKSERNARFRGFCYLRQPPLQRECRAAQDLADAPAPRETHLDRTLQAHIIYS